MKESRKHRILSTIGAVSCVVSMILSVTVLPGVAYANIKKNPLFAAALAAVTENNKGQSKSGEGGAGNEGAKGGVVKGETDNKKETKGEVKGETGKNNNVDNKVTDNKVGNGNSENPNGVGSVDKNNSGNGAGNTAGNGADKGKDKSDKANGKAAKKDAKKDGKDKKAKDQDRSTGAMEKLSLEQVKALPACVAKVNEDNTKVTITSQSGGDKCAISAERGGEFSAIREKIKSLPADGSEIHFGEGVKAYGYGSLSKGKEGLFSGANVSYIGNGKNFDVSNVTDMSYLFKDSSLNIRLFYSNAQFGNSGDLKDWDVSKVTNMEGMFEGCTGIENLNGMRDWNVSKVTNMKNMFDGCTYLDDISGLSGWAKMVGSVTDMSGMFEGCTFIVKLDGLANWNVGSVTNMSNMFKGKGTKILGSEKDEFVYGSDNLTDISALSSWAKNVGSVTNMSGMFEGRTSLKSIAALKDWNVSKVANMSRMFSQCASNSDFVSKVNAYEDEKKKYDDCIKDAKQRTKDEGKDSKKYENECKAQYPYDSDPKYTAADKKGFDISALSSWAKKVGNVTDMSNMFEGCTSLKSLAALSEWDVSKVTDMKGMFASVINNYTEHNKLNGGYAGLMVIDSLKPLNKWNVGKVANMTRMFEGCASLQNLNGLEKWHTQNVGSMISMFEYCKGVDSLKPLSEWNVGKVTDMRAMFAVCQNIQNTGDQKTNGLKNWNVSKVTSMNDMFSKCTSLYDISGLSNWATNGGGTKELTSTARMFNGCNNITSIASLANWNVGEVKDMNSMFNECRAITSIASLATWNVGKVKDMHEMFSGCSGLNTLEGLASWNVSNVEDMHEMFSGCANTYNDPPKGLTDISALSGWNVGSVTNMSSMFSACKLLKSIEPLATWDVSKVTDMPLMFYDCEKLKSLENLSKWATKVGNVTNMSGMFKACVGLKSLDGLGSWNVSNVTNMSGMFSRADVDEIGADNLTDISALSGWNVSNVTNMSSMFADCKKLTGTADLSKWDISKVTDLSSMFSNAGAESSDNFVLDFSNKTFTKSKTPLANANPDDESKHYFYVDSMFSGFRGTLIANNLQSKDFDNSDPDLPDPDDPVVTHFASSGEIFSMNEDDPTKSNNIVITDNDKILASPTNNYYIPIHAKLMEPGDMDSCKCDGSGDSGGTTYYVSALYDSTNITKDEGESLQDYAYKIVKSSFASKLRSAIDSQSGKGTGDDEPGEDPSDGDTDSDSRSARLKLRVKKLRSIKKSRSVRDDEGEGEEVSEDPESSEEKQGNTYKIMFKKSSGKTCEWKELGEGENGAVPVSDPKSPLAFFNTMYYLETFVKPVPLPHTGGQSAVMFTFLSIGLFSMFAVAGAFARQSA